MIILALQKHHPKISSLRITHIQYNAVYGGINSKQGFSAQLFAKATFEFFKALGGGLPHLRKLRIVFD